MPYTPFDLNFSRLDYEFLYGKGLRIVQKKEDADIFVASSFKKVLKKNNFSYFSKPLLIWTNEPRVSTATINFDPWLKFFKPIHFLNIYSNKVFVNNVTYQQKRFFNSKKLNYIRSTQKPLNRRLVALMSFYGGTRGNTLMISGLDLDLISKRNTIALFGHKIGLIDIYGKGWPGNISKEDSREGNWSDRKKQILSHYNFSLVFENTVYPKYITEKIWDSIENYCLPVYYGGEPSSVYEIFPAESFLDYSKFESPKAFFQKVKTMNAIEYTERMNRCIDVYNSFIDKPESFWKKTKQEMLENIIDECRLLIKN